MKPGTSNIRDMLRMSEAFPEMPDPTPTTTLRPVYGPQAGLPHTKRGSTGPSEEYREQRRKIAKAYRKYASAMLALRNELNGVTSEQ